LGLLFIVIAIAMAWHVGVALLEHYRAPRLSRPPLAKLLLTAEVEVLQTLRNELTRKFSKNPGRVPKLRLEEVERRLKEIENRNRG
jgi:hypothetical protein